MTRFDNAFVVHTQTMTNECYDTDSAHNWKCRGGNTYIVQDVTSPSNAMAFVMSAFSCNTSSDKEFPSPRGSRHKYPRWVEETMGSVKSCHTYNGVLDAVEANQHLEHIMSEVYVVSPKTGRQKFQPDDLLFFFLEDVANDINLYLAKANQPSSELIDEGDLH